jgi:hypothetical protein
MIGVYPYLDKKVASDVLALKPARRNCIPSPYRRQNKDGVDTPGGSLKDAWLWQNTIFRRRTLVHPSLPWPPRSGPGTWRLEQATIPCSFWPGVLVIHHFVGVRLSQGLC